MWLVITRPLVILAHRMSEGHEIRFHSNAVVCVFIKINKVQTKRHKYFLSTSCFLETKTILASFQVNFVSTHLSPTATNMIIISLYPPITCSLS